MTNETETSAPAAPHAPFGPSTLPPRAVCPCYDGEASSEDANAGTRSHKVLSNLLTGGDEELPGTTEDERARARWAALTIRSLRDATAPGAKIHSEESVMYCGFNNDLLGLYGTVDAWWTDGDGDVYVCDYKTYADANGEKDYAPQGMAYVVLLASNYGMADNAVSATFWTVCGGTRETRRDRFTIVEAEREILKVLRKSVAVRHSVGLFNGRTVAKCARPSAWCDHCAHRGECPAVGKTVALVQTGGILSRPLAVRMAACTVLESFVRSVKAEVKAVLDAGGRVFDPESGVEYGYGERAANSTCKDLFALSRALAQRGMTARDFEEVVSVSKAKLSAKLAEVDERAGCESTPKERGAFIRPFFESKGTVKILKRLA